jgi:DNA-binding CsgD family transcriptional regulator/PAS domain-containing protein
VVNVRNAPSPEALSNLIGSIYDCALDPSLWERTLVELKDSVHGRQAAMRLSDVRSRGFLIYKAVGIDPHWEKEHTKHVSEVHTYLADIHESSPSFDEPYVVSRRVPRAYRDSSRYGQEYLRPQGLVDNMFWFLVKTPTRFGRISVARHKEQGIYTDTEFDVGVLLLPHLRRAMTISNVLDAQKIEKARMIEALNALRCAVILCDERGAILHVNRSAEDMLRDGSLVCCVGKALSAKATPAGTELRAALRLAAGNESGIGKSGLAIRLSEPDRPAVFAHVLPLTGSDMRTGLQPAAVAAVFIAGTPNDADAASAMAAAFDLTAAETRVLASLLGGHTLGETATALAIAVTTAKTHLENIFAKTGVSRQADLMRLGIGLVPPSK